MPLYNAHKDTSILYISRFKICTLQIFETFLWQIGCNLKTTEPYHIFKYLQCIPTFFHSKIVHSRWIQLLHIESRLDHSLRAGGRSENLEGQSIIQVLSMEQVFGFISAQILVVGNYPSSPAFCFRRSCIYHTTVCVILRQRYIRRRPR